MLASHAVTTQNASQSKVSCGTKLTVPLPQPYKIVRLVQLAPIPALNRIQTPTLWFTTSFDDSAAVLKSYCAGAPTTADSVEKQRVAGSESGTLNKVRAPFWSGFSRLLRCRKGLCQFAEVLSGSGEEEFVVCAAWAA